MGQVRDNQQAIIAYKLYQIRTLPGTDEEPNPWNGYGSSEGDIIVADKILDHFETGIRTSNWYIEEEDYSEFWDILTDEYLRFLEQTLASYEEDTCSG